MVLLRIPRSDGRAIMHAELKIADSVMCVCEGFPDTGGKSSKTPDGSAFVARDGVTKEREVGTGGDSVADGDRRRDSR
jgi:uncharacterized glyoxalase superfamily protein PhnB